MITLGQQNTEEITQRFLDKFRAERDDADEYSFGKIKGEQMPTVVYHKVCGQTFESRPYLFIQDNWQKRCPHCYSQKKYKLTEADIRERIHEVSDGKIDFVKDNPRYYNHQKTHQITMKCQDCDHKFERNLQNIRGKLTCPSCHNH